MLSIQVSDALLPAGYVFSSTCATRCDAAMPGDDLEFLAGARHGAHDEVVQDQRSLEGLHQVVHLELGPVRVFPGTRLLSFNHLVGAVASTRRSSR